MAVVRWDPWRDLAAFERQLDQILHRTSGTDRNSVGWAPALDVHQEGDTMVICAEIAGIDPDEVEITLEDDVLILCGSREDHHDVEEGQWIRRERYSGRFQRSVTLPPGVDPDAIEASARHGVIEIRVPRPTQPTSHRVPLRSQDQDQGRSMEVGGTTGAPEGSPEVVPGAATSGVGQPDDDTRSGSATGDTASDSTSDARGSKATASTSTSDPEGSP